MRVKAKMRQGSAQFGPAGRRVYIKTSSVCAPGRAKIWIFGNKGSDFGAYGFRSDVAVGKKTVTKLCPYGRRSEF